LLLASMTMSLLVVPTLIVSVPVLKVAVLSA
jgi:hypothetical protein